MTSNEFGERGEQTRRWRRAEEGANFSVEHRQEADALPVEPVAVTGRADGAGERERDVRPRRPHLIRDRLAEGSWPRGHLEFHRQECVLPHRNEVRASTGDRNLRHGAESARLEVFHDWTEEFNLAQGHAFGLEK